MFLKFISIHELDFSLSWENGWAKIKNLSNFDKYMTLFWFMGPFIYLIERDPADLWLTIICLIFLIRCFIKKQWTWTSQLWFKSALALWIFGLFSALTGPDPLFSFTQGFVWIRCSCSTSMACKRKRHKNYNVVIYDARNDHHVHDFICRNYYRK